MSSDSFSVYPYTHDNLALALSNKLNTVDSVKSKSHFGYFTDYFGTVGGGLGAQTILVENKYLSKSYLIDYSNYYSTCFNNYERFCKRVHFFSSAFTKRQFISVLKNPSSKLSKLWDGYLGYIVIKPLPTVTIGATILKTYSSTNLDRRYFPATKNYHLNIFGKDITINSLAFQEQDSVVGACASSALWSAFHKTSQLFQTPLPSPSDITKSAKNLFLSSGRTFPNGGLDLFQIGNAIEAVGLDSELRNSDSLLDSTYVKSFIYAYNRLGLPVMLAIRFPFGGHLITVSGYKEGDILPFTRTEQMTLKASVIEKLYAHDDQIGPFSRLTINADGEIVTGWKNNLGSNQIAVIDSIIIPVYNKIRLTYENVYSKVRLMDFYFLQCFPGVDIYWDIYLYFSNKYKTEILQDAQIDQGLKVNLVSKSLPRYVWIAKGYVGTECVIELLFDPTEIKNSNFCININIYNPSLKIAISSTLADQGIKALIVAELGSPFLDLLENASS